MFVWTAQRRRRCLLYTSTSLVAEALAETDAAGEPYDYLAVCGPEPLMKIVTGMAAEVGVPCEVSMEKRMACGIGACLSCVVDLSLIHI